MLCNSPRLKTGKTFHNPNTRSTKSPGASGKADPARQLGGSSTRCQPKALGWVRPQPGGAARLSRGTDLICWTPRAQAAALW